VKKIVFNRLLFIFLFLGFQGAVLAQDESLSDPTKSLECLITTDFYIVHLTSYQEPKDADSKRHKFKPFCQELPEHGPSFLAIDFIDRDLRKMPIGMRVVEEIESAEDGGEMIDGATIAEIPAQLYKTGVAQIQADFPKPGRYALIVTVGDDMFADKIRIPLRVGIGSLFSWASLLPYLILILAAAIGYGIYRYFVYRYNRKKRNQDSNI
jgi:hypothetical protein